MDIFEEELIPDFEDPEEIKNLINENNSEDNTTLNNPNIEFKELSNEYIENNIKKLSNEQMTIPDGMVCDIPSSNYNYYLELKNFIENIKPNNLLIFGYSSGGARKYSIYTSNDGKIYIIYETIDRGIRIYYLTNWILNSLFEERPDLIPELKNQLEINSVI